jgi:hypothetical protein
MDVNSSPGVQKCWGNQQLMLLMTSSDPCISNFGHVMSLMINAIDGITGELTDFPCIVHFWNMTSLMIDAIYAVDGIIIKFTLYQSMVQVNKAEESIVLHNNGSKGMVLADHASQSIV